MLFDTPEFANQLKAIMRDGARHPLYKEMTAHAEAMGVHMEGDKPIYLLERARPREDAEVKQYRLENYEPTTFSAAGKAIDIAKKVLNDNLFSIRWKDKNEDIEKLEKYTFQYYPQFNSLANYNKSVTVPKMLSDPNAIMAVKPKVIPSNQSQQVDPIIIIYASENVYWYDEECYVIFISEREDERVKKYRFAYYDANWYREFESWYNEPNKEVIVTDIAFYQTEFGEIPCWPLRGIAKTAPNGVVYWESFYRAALPEWNLAVIHESDLLGAYITHLHPKMYEMAEECNYAKEVEGIRYSCFGGSLQFPGKDGKQVIQECPSCKGSGYGTVKSPYGAYQFSRKKLEEGTPSALLPVGYITIETDATKMLEERTKEKVRRGMWAINMEVEDTVGEIQSGVAKQIDRSAQYDTLAGIADAVFDVHLQNQYFFFNKYMFAVKARSTRYDEDANLPEINKPAQFDVASTSELINDYKSAKDSGLDRNFLRTKEIEILSRDLTTNPDLKKYQITMLALDPLPGFTTDDILALTAEGLILKSDGAIHSNLKPFMDRAVQEHKNFLLLDKQEQVKIFEGYADELLKKAEPAIDPVVMNVDPKAAA